MFCISLVGHAVPGVTARAPGARESQSPTMIGTLSMASDRESVLNLRRLENFGHNLVA